MSDGPKLLETPAVFSARQLAECAEREVRFRERVYPRWVAEGKMTQRKMDYELAAMKAIAERMRAMQAYHERRQG